MAYGSPNSPSEVADYLAQVRGNRAPLLDEIKHLKERYRRVGGRTPLLQITLSQAQALEQKLHSEGVLARVYVGMKHWHPFIEDTVTKMVGEGADLIVGLALAPHYSRLSIGGYEEAVRRGLAKLGGDISFTMVKNWHTQPSLIKALSRRVGDGLLKLVAPSEAAVLFTAHSLPKKAVSEDDPYHNQLLETSKLVASEAGVKLWDFAFQSAGEPTQAWCGPHIRDQINTLSREGFREILVCPVGFVSDHLEILYDIDIEAKRYADSLGVRLERTLSLNDEPEFIQALASVVKPALTSEVQTVSA